MAETSNQGIRELPKFDLLMPLAASLTWHRYRAHVHQKLQSQKGNAYLLAVAHHVTRIHRTSEGLAAFATTGAQAEISWFLRPLMEILASQCILQFGLVKFRSTRSYMTKIHKARTYFMHAKYIQRHILSKHFDWDGHSNTPEERRNRITQLEEELAKFGEEFLIDKAWHRKDFTSASRVAEKILNQQLARGPSQLAKILPVWEEFMNFGIHGSSFAAGFLIRQSEHEQSVFDDRTPCEPRYYEFGSILSIYSLELLAKEFGQEPLINSMLETAKQELEQSPKRWQPHFSTARINLEYV